MSVKVVRTNLPFGRDAREGVHLLNPSREELKEATAEAASKGFEVVYVHLNPKHRLQAQMVRV